nr:tripartite tricarboxylate transporter TctB family protein [Lysinibacillus timonensis]
MSQTYRDYVTSGFMFVVGVIAFILTFSFKSFQGTNVGVGVEFMPRVIASLILIVSAIIFINAFRNRRKESVEVDFETGEVVEKNPEDKNYKKLVISIIAMFIYALLTPILGFLITTALFLIAQMLIISEFLKSKIVLITIVSILMAVIVNYIFRNVFFVMLPQGILG